MESDKISLSIVGLIVVVFVIGFYNSTFFQSDNHFGDDDVIVNDDVLQVETCDKIIDISESVGPLNKLGQFNTDIPAECQDRGGL